MITIAWENKLDAATLSAPEVATLPANNVKHPHISRKWHTPNGTTSAALIVDMLLPTACSALALLGTNLTESATLRVRGSDSDSTGATGEKLDIGLALAGVKAGYGAAYRVFTAASARYWRIDIADTSLTSNIQVGRVFLGPSWIPTINHELDWGVGWVDPSTLSYSYGGQSYADKRPKRRVLRFELDWMSEDEAFGFAFNIARSNGIVDDVLAIPNAAGDFLSEQSLWGQLSELEPIRETRLGLFRQRFTITERL